MNIIWYTYNEDGNLVENKPTTTGQRFRKETHFTDGSVGVLESYYTAPEDLPVE